MGEFVILNLGVNGQVLLRKALVPTWSGELNPYFPQSSVSFSWSIKRNNLYGDLCIKASGEYSGALGDIGRVLFLVGKFMK